MWRKSTLYLSNRKKVQRIRSSSRETSQTGTASSEAGCRTAVEELRTWENPGKLERRTGITGTDFRRSGNGSDDIGSKDCL